MAEHDKQFLTPHEWKKLAKETGMSPRQMQIARCLLEGLGDKQIARELKVQVPTIRTHMTRLFAKLGVDDRVGVILHVMKQYCQNCCPHKQ